MSISVVIPAYNASRFIAATLGSVLRQTLAADEIIVVDDGSTDGTADIAEGFRGPVRVFRRPNKRQGASRNFGVQESKSEWIAFVDADDLWAPNKLERQMRELERRQDADVCYTNRVRFAEEGGSIHYLETPPHDVPFFPADQIREGLFRSVTFLPSSVVIRRKTFLDAGGFETSYKIVEDWDLWLRLLDAGIQFVSCSEPLLLYRVHQNNVSSTKAVLFEENMSVYRKHVQPHLTGLEKWLAPAQYLSGNKVDLAYLLRESGDPRSLNVMTCAILQWPFGDVIRYKVWLHMLLARIGLKFTRFSK